MSVHSSCTPSFYIGAFHAPLVPLFPCLPFQFLIELAVLEVRLLISERPLQGQCSHWLVVNCPQKWRLFPAFTGSYVLKPDFPVSTMWSRRQGFCFHQLQPVSNKFLSPNGLANKLSWYLYVHWEIRKRRGCLHFCWVVIHSRVIMCCFTCKMQNLQLLDLWFELYNWWSHICLTNNRDWLEERGKTTKGEIFLTCG